VAPALRRAVAPTMAKVAPPAGFEWGAADKDSTVEAGLLTLDKILISRAVRIANHVPALASLSYFGLISSTMQSMKSMLPPQPVATLESVLTLAVGPTTNKLFSQYFATPVTPAGFVFLIWPVIASLQLLTVAYSALRPGPAMTQSELTALSVANVAATSWLIASSNSLKGALPLASCLLLPLVPLFSGYPLRAPAVPRGLYKPVFDVFSSFTTLASFLALTVELLYGGRVPFFGGKAELCSLVFLGATAGVVSLPKRTLAKKLINLLALTGILVNRVKGGGSLVSLSFAATAAVWAFAASKLVKD